MRKGSHAHADVLSTGWQIGIALGIAVIAVAAAIVIVIVLLALRIARQARTAVQAVEVVRAQTGELAGIARINDSGVRILHSARVAAKGGGGEMTLTLAAISAHTYWAIALSIAFGAAVAVAILLTVLRRPSGTSRSRSTACWRSRANVAANTAYIPQLEATAPVLGADRGGGRRPGRLHERADRRVR